MNEGINDETGTLMLQPERTERIKSSEEIVCPLRIQRAALDCESSRRKAIKGNSLATVIFPSSPLERETALCDLKIITVER